MVLYCDETVIASKTAPHKAWLAEDDLLVLRKVWPMRSNRGYNREEWLVRARLLFNELACVIAKLIGAVTWRLVAELPVRAVVAGVARVVVAGGPRVDKNVRFI